METIQISFWSVNKDSHYVATVSLGPNGEGLQIIGPNGESLLMEFEKWGKYITYIERIFTKFL